MRRRGLPDPEFPADRARAVQTGLLAHPDPVENLRMSLAPGPTPGGQMLTMPDPNFVPAARFLGMRGAPLVTPEENRRALDNALMALSFAGGMSAVRGGGALGRGTTARYSGSDDPIPPTPRDRASLPAGTDDAPAAAAAPPRATLDPEGRLLTAPRIFGRDANLEVLPPSPLAVGSLLDDLAGSGVTRGVPLSEMPRTPRGTALGEAVVPRVTLGSGERAQAAARVRIAEGQPFGSGIEAHEVGHLSHFIRSGAARLTPAAMKELSRIFSEGGYRSGSTLARDELYANGIQAYLSGGAATRLLLDRAPTAAAPFRSHVNTHPVLSRYFQLNTLYPALLTGGAAAGLLDARPGEDQ